jgi:hydrogenase large subunit
MTRIINVAMNRVEGDLELKVALEGNRVVDAWTTGTMYRGFEQILIGRDALDGLLITPRICGICGTAHQYAAVAALETAFQCEVAPNGVRIRNLCLAAEEIQSDAKHTFLMFVLDLLNGTYRTRPWYEQAQAYFAPGQGRVYKEVVRQSRKPLEIVAIFGGQWPHSSYMLPGGVVTPSHGRRLIEGLGILDAYQRWYETTILGCSAERWLAIQSPADLDAWLDEKAEHWDSPAGLFIRISRDAGLARLGRGQGNLLSCGGYHDPVTWQPPFDRHQALRPAGFYNAATGLVAAFDHRAVAEHVRHSWFLDYDGGRHPWEGETIPDYQPGSDKYSWAKAPRYHNHVIETGPLAELVMAGDPLSVSLFKQMGSNAWLRQFIRLHRPVLTMQLMRRWLQELAANGREPNLIPAASTREGMGYGLINATRGGLGHWIQVANGKIERYQIVTPTAWNASPRDSEGRRGHWEESFVGTEIADVDNPVELGHIVRSHDACLVCTVHVLETDQRLVYPI